MTARVKRIERTGSFTATDAHGRPHTLHVFISIIDTGPFKGPHAEIMGVQAIRTEDGEKVSRVGRGEYQILGGETLRSDDSDAP
jgi:hypothetical protein